MLFSLFFVWHGFVYYFDLIPLRDAALLFLFFAGLSVFFYLISLLIFRKRNKASFFSFVLMIYYIFFGYFHDGIKQLAGNSFFSRYSFVLPASLLLFIIIAIGLKKFKGSLSKTNLYLNTLFIILLLIDSGVFILKISKSKQQTTSALPFLPCDRCSTPDIYLIIADSYPGKTELKEKLDFDNTPFENALQQRGFHVIDSSTSNYNFTPFSVSSMLNMEYLKGINGSNSNKDDILKCYTTIKNNQTLQYLASLGYSFYNYSIFDFNKQPSLAKPTFLPRKTQPLVSHTLRYRMQYELGHLLITRFKIKSVIRNIRNLDLRNNNELFELTKKQNGEHASNPKFVYTHLVMPHYPYYFDSSGKQIPYEKLTDDYIINTDAFLQYLVYGNQKYLELIDDILKSSKNPPVIILMGDHGFREFPRQVDPKYYFMNLNAILLPGKNYSQFYNGMSSVNQFRIILNTVFNQKLPILKDSTSFITE